MQRIIMTIFLGISLFAAPVMAQNSGLFAPRVMVNGKAITNWEVQQRIQFLQLLGAPGDLEDGAVEGLIEDRLRMSAADLFGFSLPPEAVEQGMAEFAGRSNLELEQFLTIVNARGIDTSTFRDFVEAGLVWREIVRGRFGPSAQISEAEIDRAISLTTQTGSARVLLSEIILRADTPEFAAQSQALADRLSESISSPSEFAAAARQYSVSGSKGRGGRIDWLDLSTLPPQIASQLLSLADGEVTDPLPLSNAIALFQLRAIEEIASSEPETLAVEYAQYTIAEGSDPKRVTDRVDTCDDLYGIAKGQPEELLQRNTLTIADLPADLALDLAKLDPGETVLRGNSIVMLCGRTPALGEEVDREGIRSRLFNQRLASYADGYLAELRSDAIIRYP